MPVPAGRQPEPISTADDQAPRTTPTARTAWSPQLPPVPRQRPQRLRRAPCAPGARCVDAGPVYGTAAVRLEPTVDLQARLAMAQAGLAAFFRACPPAAGMVVRRGLRGR